jgi:response regulator RpfG family c-di-GMP phosphodiesterase
VSHEEARELILQGRGTEFDPDVVDAFLENEEAFRSISSFDEFEEHPERFQELIDQHVQELSSSTTDP